MKFGKRLRLVQNLRWNLKWADFYVDYKLLKNLVNTLKTIDINSPESVAEINKYMVELLRGGEDESLLNIVTLASSANIEEKEKEKVEEIPKQRRLSTRRSSFSVNVGDIRQKSFMEVLKREFVKLDNFCREEIRNLESKLKNAQRIVILKEDDEQKSEIRINILNLFQSAERIESFLSINILALRKICKKFDKHIECVGQDTLSNQVIPYVEKIELKHRNQMNLVQQEIDKLFQVHGKPSEMEQNEIAQKELEHVIVEDQYPTYTELKLKSFAPGSINRLRLLLAYDGLSQPITIPVIVVKGKFEGPVLGITAALHGNELNGIPLIFKLVRELDLDGLSGSVVAIPVLNGPGFLRHQRGFSDGSDLNRLFPGKPNGNSGQFYCHQIMEKVIKFLDYHIDMHTASFGRVNSLYVRADMNNRVTHQMAFLQDPQIIVHNTAPDGSLRSAAMKIGIPSITVEIGDPSRIHRRFVRAAFLGVENILCHLKMLDDEIEVANALPTICSRSFWMYSQSGGILHVLPDINTWVQKDQVIARVRNLFGDIIATYTCPCDGIVVGKNVDPVCSTGDRILHLGVVEDEFPSSVDDGHV